VVELLLPARRLRGFTRAENWRKSARVEPVRRPHRRNQRWAAVTSGEDAEDKVDGEGKGVTGEGDSAEKNGGSKNKEGRENQEVPGE
jgi:hypothetical protein